MISQIPQVLWRETTTEDSVEEFEVLIQVTRPFGVIGSK